MSTPSTLELLDDAACAPAQEPEGPGVLMAGDTPFPLRAMDVQARISGPLASVDVRQTFANTFSTTIEAVYIFPLPLGAAVHRFRLRVGERVVDGVVKERGQAREEYAEGLRQGHRAALLEQERDNVFTVQVGNLPPGEEVSVELSYAGRLETDLADTTFRFPLVVAPRYIPGQPLDGAAVGHGTTHDTRRVRDASRITPPILHPGLRSGARLSLRVLLDTGGMLPQKLAASQHATSLGSQDGTLTVELSRADELLDRDFVLRFRLAAEEARPLLLVDDRHFLLSLVPPRETRVQSSRDVLFLLDRSGSMGGAKMESARRAVARFLELLEPGDRFALEAFDSSVESYHRGAFSDPSATRDAVRWLQGIDARGGTEILEPLERALDRKPEKGRVLCVVLITDGQVGNEPEIYRMVQQRSQGARLFTLGIDTAVNDAFLRRAAALGRGTCELVTPGEDLELSLQRLARETGRPLLVDLELVDAGLHPDPDSLAPSRIPDLFAARASFVLGRKTGTGPVDLKARRPDGATWEARVQPQATPNAALGIVWARERVTALEDRLRLRDGDPAAVEAEILALAVEYQILTRFTAFVLVDSAEVVNQGGKAQTVVQPVQMPAEWDMQAPSGVAYPIMAPASHRFACREGSVADKAKKVLSRGRTGGLLADLGQAVSPSLRMMKSSLPERRQAAPPSPPACKPAPKPAEPAPRTLDELLKDLLQCVERLGRGQGADELQELLRQVLDLLKARREPELQALLADGLRLQAGDPTRELDVLKGWVERLQRQLDDSKRFWRDNV